MTIDVYELTEEEQICCTMHYVVMMYYHVLEEIPLCYYNIDTKEIRFDNIDDIAEDENRLLLLTVLVGRAADKFEKAALSLLNAFSHAQYNLGYMVTMEDDDLEILNNHITEAEASIDFEHNYREVIRRFHETSTN